MNFLCFKILTMLVQTGKIISLKDKFIIWIELNIISSNLQSVENFNNEEIYNNLQ